MAKIPDVIQLFNPIISFLRCYGVVPLKKCDKEPYFERSSGLFCWCLSVALIYLFTFVISVRLVIDTFNSSSKMIADATFYLIYYAHCEMTLVFFLYYSGEIVSLFQHWVETERLLHLRQIFLGKITKAQCWLIFIATVILSNLENGFYITSAVCCVSLKVNLQIIINKFIVFIFTR
jgi:gustatory receptor